MRILAYLLVLRPRGSGYSTNVYMLIRGGSAPRSNSLHFYKPFFYVKGNPFVYLLLTNGISFTDLISNFASLLTSHQASQQTNSGHVCAQPGLPVPEAASFDIFGCNYVCIDVCTSPHLPRFQVWPSKSRLFRSQSIDSERKQKNVQNTNNVWYGKLKTESPRKLSNFNFQWGKTLYQNNLTNIAFFFTFFKSLRCNNKSSVVTPKKISQGRQRKWMSNLTRYVITQVNFWKFHV